MALAIEASGIKPATIFIAGAGNARRRPRWALLGPFAAPLDIIGKLHSDVTEGLYRSLGGMVADEVLVPANFGVGTPNLSYRLMDGVISETIKKYDGRPIRLRGHSLGGFLAVEYAHNHPELTIEVDAWSAPFGKVNIMPGVGYLFRERTSRIQKIRQELGNEAPKVTLLGSDGDHLIPPSSSLPDLPGVQKIFFTSSGDRAVSIGAYPIHVENPPGHVGILNHPDALPLHEDIDYRPRLINIA
jgi:pimeloyl-ACP methyl ester carboxylesterase